MSQSHEGFRGSIAELLGYKIKNKGEAFLLLPKFSVPPRGHREAFYQPQPCPPFIIGPGPKPPIWGPYPPIMLPA